MSQTSVPSHREQDLGQDVESVLDRAGRLDIPLADGADDDRRLHDVLVVGGEKCPPAHGSDPVAGAPHPLDGRGDRRRRLDEDDLVERADIDPQLERVRGHDGLEGPRLEPRLDIEAKLFGKGAMVGIGKRGRLAGVDPEGQALGGPAAPDKKERGAVPLDDPAEFPDKRRPELLFGAVPGARVGTDDLQLIGFIFPGLDDRHRPGDIARFGPRLRGARLPISRPGPRRRLESEPAHKLRDSLHRLDRRRHGDPLEFARAAGPAGRPP